MFSNLQISRTLVKNEVRMNAFRKTVSQNEMQEEWVEIQAAQKNPARFRPLYDRYFESIFRFIHRRTSNEEIAGDICSQVFLKALQKLGTYSFKGVPFSAWLFRIASNEVAQYFRTANKQRIVSIQEYTLHDMVDEMEDVESIEQLKAALIASLDDLREKDLLIIEMRFFENRPFKEISQILEITESNAKVRTYRVLERLKKQILKKI